MLRAEERLGQLPDDRRAAEPGERVVALQGGDDRAGRELSAGRWWSVTTTSSPSEAACATSSTAVMPQSTVSTRSNPSSASRVSVCAVQPVALLEPGRQMPGWIGTELAQQQHGERGRADAVGVVVAVHADARPRLDRSRDRGHRRAHVAEQERVVTRTARRPGSAPPRRGRRSRGGRAPRRSPRRRASAAASASTSRCEHGASSQVPAAIGLSRVRPSSDGPATRKSLERAEKTCSNARPC